MRISKKGITFNYNNDEITWFWWWVRDYTAFFSLIYNFHFDSFKEYWQKVGSTDRPLPISKLKGYTVETMIEAWVRQYCRVGTYLVLYDINVEAKPASFWRTIPDKDKTQLLSDIVVLECKDVVQASRLITAIPDDFAKAMLVRDGYSERYVYADTVE